VKPTPTGRYPVSREGRARSAYVERWERRFRQIPLAVRSLMSFVAEHGDTEKERAGAAAMAAFLADNSGGDHICLSARPVDHGVAYRVRLEPLSRRGRVGAARV